VNIHDFHLAWVAGAQQSDGRWQQLGTALPLATIPEWVAAAGTFVGPFVGLLGALWLYAKRNEDEKRRRDEENREALLRQLQAEFGANQQTIQRSLTSIGRALASKAHGEDANEPIYDEEFYLAPLVASSWEALTQTDAHRVLTSARLEQLFGYYTSVARANWLLARIQTFKFRAPILREIEKTLSDVRDTGEAVDFAALESELLPSGAQAETSDSDRGSD
jgi:hypothetical protein